MVEHGWPFLPQVLSVDFQPIFVSIPIVLLRLLKTSWKRKVYLWHSRLEVWYFFALLLFSPVILVLPLLPSRQDFSVVPL